MNTSLEERGQMYRRSIELSDLAIQRKSRRIFSKFLVIVFWINLILLASSLVSRVHAGDLSLCGGYGGITCNQLFTRGIVEMFQWFWHELITWIIRIAVGAIVLPIAILFSIRAFLHFRSREKK